MRADRDSYTCWLVLGFALTSGCSGQVDSDYRGESPDVAATLDIDPRQKLEGDTAIALIWELMSPRAFDLGQPFGDFVSVTPKSATTFRINVIQPPTPELLVDVVDGNALAVAKLLWVHVDAPSFAPAPAGAYSILGAAENHVLVYVRDDVAVDSETARFLHDTPAAGYHIYELDRAELVPPCETRSWREGDCDQVESTCARDVLLPTPDDLRTSVPITASGNDRFLFEDLAKVCEPE
ncbi:MAG: hypothetical protein ABW217_06910 [Polyangiaceae bacterium]